jgi:hypothetical protein
MIIDVNRGIVMEEFHFQNSLRTFIQVSYPNDEYGCLFIDVDNHEAYSWEELEREGLLFYEKEDDENFMGVNTDW